MQTKQVILNWLTGAAYALVLASGAFFMLVVAAEVFNVLLDGREFKFGPIQLPIATVPDRFVDISLLLATLAGAVLYRFYNHWRTHWTVARMAWSCRVRGFLVSVIFALIVNYVARPAWVDELLNRTVVNAIEPWTISLNWCCRGMTLGIALVALCEWSTQETARPRHVEWS